MIRSGDQGKPGKPGPEEAFLIIGIRDDGDADADSIIGIRRRRVACYAAASCGIMRTRRD